MTLMLPSLLVIRKDCRRLKTDLLDHAKVQFAFINEREYIELRRLQDDRHVCAHPAFVDVEQVFSPTAELVRVHLSTAVAAVLSQSPTPGRKALDRFFAESKASTWPSARVDLAAYLRDNYLDRGKQSLRENLSKVIIKGVLKAPEGNELISERLAEAAHALGDVTPALLEFGLRQVVTNRFQSGGLSEDEQLRLVGRLGDMAVVWDAIPVTAKPGLVAAIERRPLLELTGDGILSTAQAYAEATAAVESRLLRLTLSIGHVNALRSIIGINPAPHLWLHALRVFGESLSYRSAEDGMRGLILPFAPQMTAAHVRRIATATLGNPQIREAANMPSLMEYLFNLVPHSPTVLAEWEAFVSKLVEAADGDTSAYYAYPGLQALVAEAKAV